MYLLKTPDTGIKHLNVHFDNEEVIKRRERKKERWFQFLLVFTTAVLASAFTVIIEHFFAK